MMGEIKPPPPSLTLYFPAPPYVVKGAPQVDIEAHFATVDSKVANYKRRVIEWAKGEVK